MRPFFARNRRRIGARASALILGLLTLRPAAPAAQDFEKGKIIPKVECLADPAENYALYLPSGYDPGRAWPVLVLFDPAARGGLAAAAFMEGAERRGFILAASNTARNGPWEPIIRAARAVHRDVSERFAIDAGRLYAAGFSGGARAISLFARMIEKPVAGLIGCGAGLAPDVSPSQVNPGVYLGLVGTSDFNYGEVRRLDADLSAAGVLHRMFYFEGKHAWPEPVLCDRALAWLEIAAMKSGARPKDEAVLGEVFARELEEAAALEADGRLSAAAAAYDAMLAFFGELLDTSGLAAKTTRLKASKAFERSRTEDSKRADFESKTLAGFRDVLRAVGEAPALGSEIIQIRKGLQVGRWKSETSSARTPEERALAGRLLIQLALDAESLGREAYRRNVLSKAVVFFDIAAEACSPREGRYPYILYNYACVLALSGDRNKALDCLDLAVGAGYSDVKTIEEEKDFDALRETPRFQELLAKLKSRAPGA